MDSSNMHKHQSKLFIELLSKLNNFDSWHPESMA